MVLRKLNLAQNIGGQTSDFRIEFKSIWGDLRRIYWRLQKAMQRQIGEEMRSAI